MQNPVAVTGATGFVGGHLLRALLAQGQQVRALVRNPSKLDVKDPNLEVIKGDLHNVSALDNLVRGASVVIHCAGAIAALDRESFFNINVTGAENVAKSALAAKVARFIHVSSLAARHGELSSYAASKSVGEEVVGKTFGRQNLLIVRPPAVYGPGDVATLPLIKALTRKKAILPGGEDQKLSLIFVKDLADALVHLIDLPSVKSDILEIDDGRKGGYSFQNIVDLAGQAQGRDISLIFLPRSIVRFVSYLTLGVAKLTSKPAVLSPEKVCELYHPNWVAKEAKISGWQPKIQFKEGFGLALSWYQQNGWLPGGAVSASSQDMHKTEIR